MAMIPDSNIGKQACPHCGAPIMGTQFDPDSLDVFIVEETTLRNMVELKCGTAEVHDIHLA